jgi:hypothetical protein
MAGYVCNPSTWEAETEGSQIQSQPVSKSKRKKKEIERKIGISSQDNF